MNLPKDFELAYIGDGTQYRVIVEDLTKTYNGVDADGAPKNWTNNDFEPLQMVVCRNGKKYFVVPDESHGMAGADPDGVDGWITLYTIDNVPKHEWLSEDYMRGYAVVEVYSPAPRAFHAFTTGKSDRKLLWKYVEPTADEEVTNDFSERIAFFQQHIDAVKENLESLQAGFDKLKSEIQGG